jgi:hypothetical protein
MLSLKEDNMQTRVCTRCKVEKDLSLFNKHNRGKYGHVAQCKECYKLTNRERYLKDPRIRIKNTRNRRKRLKWIKDYKESRGCRICGLKIGAILDFHHVRGKDFNISENYGKAWSVFEKEVQKCLVLCANHHRMVHAKLINIDHLID